MRSVAVQSADPRSMLSLVRRLIWYRRSTPDLYGGTYRSLDVGDERCSVYLRQAAEQRRLVALNLTDEDVTISVPGQQRGQVARSTYLDREGPESLSGLLLRPDERVIIEL